MSLLGALSCSRLRVPLPGLAELRAAGPATVLGMGVCNAATCYLFMLSLSLLPLSLCMTIRAATPAGAVLFGLASGRTYSVEQCLSLLPMLGGFALAVNAQGSSSLPGVAAALGSLLALNGVQHCSRACSVRGLHDVQVQWLQCTLCLVLLAPALSPTEVDQLRRSLRGSRTFCWLSLLNGLSDYVENLAATRCCGRLG